MIEHKLRFNRVVWFGAGACWDCGLPLGDAAAREIVQCAFRRLALDSVLESVERDGVNWPRFEVVLDVLSHYVPHAPKAVLSTFRGVGKASTPTFLATQACVPWLWLTTNFDDQIERSLEAAGREYRVVTKRREMATLQPDGQHCVVKLHGDSTVADVESDLGVKIGQILRAFPAPAESRLADLTNGLPLLVVGYAARDPDLSLLVRSVVGRASSVDWVALGDPSEQVLGILGKKGNYHPEGAPAAVQAILGGEPPQAERSDVWSERIGKWLGTLSREDLLQFAAAVLVEAGGKVASRAVSGIHGVMTSPSQQHLLWKLERSARLLSSGSASGIEDADAIRGGLQELIGSDVPDISVRAALALAKWDHLAGHSRRGESLLRSVDLDSVSASTKIDTLLMLGIMHVYGVGAQLSAGVKELEEVQNLAVAAREPVQAAEAALRQSIGLMRLDRPKDAIALLERSEPVAMEIGTPRSRLVWGQNLAEAYRNARHIAEAIKRNTDVLEFAEQLGEQDIVALAKNSLGLCFLSLGNFEEADRAFLESGEVPGQIGGGESVSNAYFNRGWLRILSGLWNEALSLLGFAEDLYRQSGNGRVGAASALIGWAWLMLGDRQRAQAKFDEIRAKKEMPDGLMKWEYELLACGLAAHGVPDESWLDEALQKLAGGPEQRCQFCLWAATMAVDEEFLDRAFLEAERAAEESVNALLVNAVAKQRDKRR